MKLRFNEKLVGTIGSDFQQEDSWYVSEITLTEFGSTLRPFLHSLTDEIDLNCEGDFDAELYNEEKWIILVDGVERGIELPAIYFDDNSIYWRWR